MYENLISQENPLIPGEIVTSVVSVLQFKEEYRCFVTVAFSSLFFLFSLYS